MSECSTTKHCECTNCRGTNNKYPEPDSYAYGMTGKYPVYGGTCMPHFGLTSDEQMKGEDDES